MIFFLRYTGGLSGRPFYIFCPGDVRMQLLYLDEAGTHPGTRHVVVGGLAIFERSAYWLQQDLGAVVQRFYPETHASVELHASPASGQGR